MSRGRPRKPNGYTDRRELGRRVRELVPGRAPCRTTALSKFFAGRCSCDAKRLGAGWLPGFCPHPGCRNWDWRMPSGDPIDRPLSCAEVGAVLGVSRQRVNQIEAIALGKFLRRLHGKAVTLPLNWWAKAADYSPAEFDVTRLSTRRLPCRRCGRRVNGKCRCAERFAARRAA